jgi:hypothetical protein
VNGRWLLVGKLLAAIVPLLLAALVAIAWNNSHTMAVQGRDIAALHLEVQHLRELIEKPLR